MGRPYSLSDEDEPVIQPPARHTALSAKATHQPLMKDRVSELKAQAAAEVPRTTYLSIRVYNALRYDNLCCLVGHHRRQEVLEQNVSSIDDGHACLQAQVAKDNGAIDATDDTV